MKSDLENNKVTQPTELRDFFEWHQGIPYYGFWAIEIQHPECLQRIKHCQELFADKLHPNYLRQAHITLSASGLLSENHFTDSALRQQIEKLNSANLPAFSLQLTEPNSFTTALYLSIQDPTYSLSLIRNLLHSISHAQDPSHYTPHATLGFYQQAYKISELFTHISPLDFPPLKFAVTEIVFARYNTHEIQGRYEVLHRIALKPSRNKSD